MQSFRTSLRRLPPQFYRITKTSPVYHYTTTKPAAAMSLFPRFNSEVPTLFRFLEDYDRIARSAFNNGTNTVSSAHTSTLHHFSPKFDVKEIKDAYELHGELPGIDQKDINIEWSDGNTLTISGRTEHRSERGNLPSKQQAQGFIEEGSPAPSNESATSQQNNYHKATVEDEGTTEGAVTKTTPESSKQVAKPAEDEAAPKSRYWVTERSVGEFSRAFSFPARVDQDAVRASLKNGVLSVVVPKAKRIEPRRIQVDIE